MTATTYDYEALCAFATALGESVGLPPDRARMQSEILLEADIEGYAASRRAADKDEGEVRSLRRKPEPE